METIDSKATLNDIVFEERNKAYGAFLLRKIYGKHIIIALAASAWVFTLALVSPMILSKFKAVDGQILNIREFDLSRIEVPPINPETPPPPPPPAAIEPPKLDMVKFLEPEVKPDELVTELPPAIEDLVLSNPGEITQVGDFNFNELIVDGGGSDLIGYEDDNIYLEVDEKPSFEGGEEALLNFLRKNVKYPAKALTMGMEGTVEVGFTVNKEGKVSDIKILKGIPGYGLDEEALRVVSLPGFDRWSPGKINGRAVATKYKTRITYKIPE